MGTTVVYSKPSNDFFRSVIERDWRGPGELTTRRRQKVSPKLVASKTRAGCLSDKMKDVGSQSPPFRVPPDGL